MLSLIAVIAVGVPVALALLTGSLGIPHNDAWSHAVIAQTYARTGNVELVGWNRTGLLGQIVVLGPLGASIVAQQVFVAVLACLGLLATYVFCRSRVGTARALFATAVIAFLPEFGLLATSYMSDMPAFVAAMTCLALADRAIRRGDIRVLSLAVLVGLWGATIREQTLAAPAAALLGYAWTWHRSRLWQPAVLAVGAGVAFGLFEVYRRGLPNGDPPEFAASPHQGVITGLSMLFTLSLYIAPAVALAAKPWTWSVPGRVAAAVALAGALAFAASRRGDVFLGNYLDHRGAYSAASSGSRDLFPHALLYLLSVIACLALAVCVGLAVSGAIHLDRLSGLFALTVLGGTLAQSFLGQSVFGRYLLPLAPIALVAVLSVRHRVPDRAISGGRLMWVAPMALLASATCLSLALTSNALAFDAARWKAAERLVSAGRPADTIDAGLEWVGYHAAGPALKGRVPVGYAPWYVAMFPGSKACVTISASPRIDAEQPSGTFAYKTFAVAGQSELIVYEWPSC